MGAKYRRYRGWLASEIAAWEIPPAVGKRRLYVTRLWGYKQRAMDRINFAAGCKPLLDVLCTAGHLVGDAPHQLDDWYDQMKSTDGIARVRLRIEELLEMDDPTDERDRNGVRGMFDL
jgi:hypothetical protein